MKVGSPNIKADLVGMRIADLFVKILSVENKEVVSRFDDPALGCYGPGSVDVVPGHHPHRDPGPLALLDSIRYLVPHGILDTLLEKSALLVSYNSNRESYIIISKLVTKHCLKLLHYCLFDFLQKRMKIELFEL